MDYTPININDVFQRVSSITYARTQKELAKELEVSQNAISRWKAERTINLNYLEKFAKKHNKSLIWLLSGSSVSSQNSSKTKTINFTDKIEYMSFLENKKKNGILTESQFALAMDELWKNSNTGDIH